MSRTGASKSVGSLSGTAGGTVTLGNGTTLHVNQSTTTTFAGRIGGTGDLFKSGTGTLILTGTNDYTGDTLVSDGRLELGPGGGLAPSTSLSVTFSGVFDLENGGQTVGGLSGGSGGSVNLGNGSLTVDQATNSFYDGGIGGTGGLTKSGIGTLIFAGTGSYTGGTQVDAGTLVLDTGGSLASTGALTVNGGVFDLENGGQTVGALPGTGGAVHPRRRQPHREPVHDHELRRQHRGHRRPDQVQRRDIEPHRRQRLHRRHRSRRRHAAARQRR